MIKSRWRNVRRRSSNGNGSSIGSSSGSGSSFENSTNTISNSKAIDSLVKRIQLPKGCLKVKPDDLLKLYDEKLMGSIPLPRIQKNVTFQHVYIREYERTVGDNPSCSSGAPLR
jgi:hypothetical protein